MKRNIKIALFIIIPALFLLFIYLLSFSEKREISQNIVQEDSISYENPGIMQETKENIENNEELEKNNEELLQKKDSDSNSQEEQKNSFKIIKKMVSWGYSVSKNRSIDTIVIHSSYNALGGDYYSLSRLLEEYKQYGVAPHYLIDREGKIYQLVSDQNIAYHAGESKTPDKRTNVNNFSIGIEIMNTEDAKPASIQYEALNSLLSSLKSSYKIKYVLGHSQIASGRKTDPWNFNWDKI